MQRDVEAGAHRDLASPQLLQPAGGVGQAAGQLLDGPARPGGQPGAGDPDREGQPPAGCEHLGGGVRLGGHALAAHHVAEQRQRLDLGQDVQVERVRAGQHGQRLPARDQHAARRAAGQERPHLLGAVRVVQQHEQAAVGGQRAEAGRRLLDGGRDRARFQAQRAQHAAQRVQRVERRDAGRRALEVHVDLAVRKAAGGDQQVGGVDGQRRLADATHPVDRADDDRRAVLQQLDQRAQLGLAAGEVRGGARQLARHAGDLVELELVGDGQAQLLQAGPEQRPELLAEVRHGLLDAQFPPADGDAGRAHRPGHVGLRPVPRLSGVPKPIVADRRPAWRARRLLGHCATRIFAQRTPSARLAHRPGPGPIVLGPGFRARDWKEDA
ncbi:MAG TPA: hypothetical protein VOB72_07080 [Candidatus Dormibacteraeota bacterium]|nr:hypothetical protein [Candidatus Dormibacteraeota bacterium]